MEYRATIEHSQNPRVELEEHYYNPVHTRLLELGLEPHFLSNVLIDSMLRVINKFKHRIKPEIIQPRVKWIGRAAGTEELKKMGAGS